MRLIDADKLSLEVADKHWDKVILEGVREYNPYAIRNEIIELIGKQPIVQQWHKLTFRPTTLEEKEFHPYWTKIVENLPNLNEEVLVTDGTNIWVDGFDMDDFLCLSVSGYEVDGVIAWMEIPSYTGTQND